MSRQQKHCRIQDVHLPMSTAGMLHSDHKDTVPSSVSACSASTSCTRSSARDACPSPRMFPAFANALSSASSAMLAEQIAPRSSCPQRLRAQNLLQVTIRQIILRGRRGRAMLQSLRNVALCQTILKSTLPVLRKNLRTYELHNSITSSFGCGPCCSANRCPIQLPVGSFAVTRHSRSGS